MESNAVIAKRLIAVIASVCLGALALHFVGPSGGQAIVAIIALIALAHVLAPVFWLIIIAEGTSDILKRLGGRRL